MRENNKSFRKILILLFFVSGPLLSALPEQKEKYNHQGNLEAAQSHVDFLLGNLEKYPAGIGYTPEKTFESFPERVAAVDKVFESHSTEADKRDPFFKSANTVKPIFKYFVDVINEYESSFVDINGRSSNESDRISYFKRKFPGVEYKTLKKFLISYEDAQRLHSQKDGVFWSDLSKKKEGLISVWPENSNAIHPKLSADEFKKYFSKFPKDKSCSIKKIEDIEKDGVKNLRIYVDEKTFFDIESESISVQTPFNKGYKNGGISTPFSIDLGRTQWFDESAVMRFDKVGQLKEIRITMPGKELNTAWLNSIGSFLTDPSSSKLSVEEVDKDISYKCKVDSDAYQGQMSGTASKALQDGNRSEGKSIPKGEVIFDPTMGPGGKTK